MTTTHLAAVLALLTLAPDVIPPGQKGIRVERRIELAAAAAPCCHSVTVQPGDTLAKIAKERLGSADRWSDIAACNPGLAVDTIRPEQRIWVPPPPRPAGEAGAAAPPPARAVFVGTFARNVSIFEGLSLDEPVVPRGRDGRVVLYLVDTAVAPAPDARKNHKQRQELDDLVTRGKAERVACDGPGNLVDRDSKIARRVDTFRLQPKAGGGHELVLASSEAFDAAGARLDPPKVGTAGDGGNGGAGKQEALLPTLAGSAALLLWWRRRRTVPVAAV